MGVIEARRSVTGRGVLAGAGGTGLRAGRLLAVLSLAPALVLTAWVLAAFPLAAVGQFRPYLVIPLAVVVAVVLVPLGLSLAARVRVVPRAPWWSVVAVVAIAVAFAVFAALTHDEHVVPRRDAGSYAQIAYWLAHQHGLRYQPPLADFGPSPGALGFASPAFFQPDDTVIPQFMTGWPIVLAGADWLAGWTGLLVAPAVIGGCAVLAVGGLAARVLGARWAPFAAALTALAWPLLRVSQETMSEPLALLLLAAGCCLLVDLVLATGRHQLDQATGDLRRRIHRLAFAAGLLLGTGELVRMDFGVDLALVLPLLGWLVLSRRPGTVPFLAGAAIGGGLGALDGVFVTRPYIALNRPSVLLMVLLFVVVAVAVVVAVVLLRRFGGAVRAARWWRPVPAVGTALLLLIGIGLFVRPWVSVDHSTSNPGIADFIETMQQHLGLPADGTRGYAEESLRWVSWYVGWPLLIAALAGAAALTWRVLHGRDTRWLPVLLLFLCPAVLVLVRPGITPDHPWADRRLVVEVLPALILTATWTAMTLSRYGRLLARRMPARRPLLVPAIVVAVLALFVVPIVLADAPVATKRTEQGELAATAEVCRTLRPTDTVVLIDPQWMPTIRAQCGLTVGQLLKPSPAAVARVVASIRAAGRTPVIAGSQVDSPRPLGLTPTATVELTTTEDQQQLVRRPDGTNSLYLRFWLVRL